MIVCYIALGSNIGDRLSFIQEAVKRVRMLSYTRVRKVSSIIESAPEGNARQPHYLNGVMEIETELLPFQLLKELQDIEYGLGRMRSARNEPRTIDLDILLYGDALINEYSLCIPHPKMYQRTFVLGPLKEIAPEVFNVVVKKTRGKAILKKRKKSV